ncbi:signal recognition particle-docking protein FtsY [Clostridium luticellarii]|jgi:fused signal recognition particle receptor|uniref:Signal recognition particle receptor FtsY n=1 Tax=Clostridium luticellarii TaxID=1691940 RepID=A0A2T0BRA6_9CLOT|nr:signal recognition particle-docking protein FtsY [Clostridium luticellarii]MCI1943884.1 signal recognition particle-docking protein FtsY [Clostridium luticellarii]MCI1967145.1 signal recognition particle-docking protein FtsY [Clostridium luticellarii]MCI1994512.1 signal recognition particle-docking protein FtsY [Clostridium luticellarii]MCI2038535.1 signal recognition particle-docking protein FtsY [Clostridium luticellarii]PRR86410.1 Signal recognition particle receptor FtsY [Clostridium lu
MFKEFFDKLKNGLEKTKNNLTGKITDMLSQAVTIDEELYDQLEEILITADIGVETTMYIIDRLKEKIKEDKIKDPALLKDSLKEIVIEILGDEENSIVPEKTPEIILVIGVNGVGKTTSIGKICYKLKDRGYKVIMAAADTFRAAAIDQLEVWSERAGVEIIKHQEGSDPAAVIFDAIQASKARKKDVLICDTAGRLHNKKNLMNELGKINKVIEREYGEAFKQTFLVLDATTGQNAVQQAKQFKEVCPVDGIILTKLDGTAKGGIVISIKHSLNIPVKLIGVGEGIDDLQEFKSRDFVDALF